MRDRYKYTIEYNEPADSKIVNRYSRFMLAIAALLLLLSIFTSCSKRPQPKQHYEVSFSVLPYPQEIATKANTKIFHLPVGTRVRILAYRRTNENQAIDIENAIPKDDKVYVVSNSSGYLRPENGSMSLIAGYYDFYAYTPALGVYKYPIVKVEHGTDLIGSPAILKQKIDKTTTIAFPLFKHRASQVLMQISLNNPIKEIKSMEVADAGIALYYQSTSPAPYQIGGVIPASKTAQDNYKIEKTHFGAYTEENDIYTIKGDDVILPKKPAPYSIDFNLKINNADKILSSNISSMAFMPGFRYRFKLDFLEHEIVCKMSVVPWNNYSWSEDFSGGYTFNIGKWDILGWDTDFSDGAGLIVGPWKEYNWAETIDKGALAVVMGWIDIDWDTDFATGGTMEIPQWNKEYWQDKIGGSSSVLLPIWDDVTFGSDFQSHGKIILREWWKEYIDDIISGNYSQVIADWNNKNWETEI